MTSVAQSLHFLTLNPRPHLNKMLLPDEQNAFVPLRDVTEHIPNGVKIRVRCSNKSPIKEYGSSNGKVFVCTFLDNSGEIRMTFFGECSKHFHPSIQVGKVYILQHFQAKPANERFDLLKLGVELNAIPKTIITETQVVENVPSIKLRLTDIATVLNTKTVGERIDLVGICKALRVDKKCAFLTDETNGKIYLALADEILADIEKFDGKNPVILVRNAFVQMLNGHKILSCHSLVSYLYINPDLPQTKILNELYLEKESCVIIAHCSKLIEALKMIREASSQQLDRGIQFINRIQISAINKETAMQKICRICQTVLYQTETFEQCCVKCNAIVSTWDYKCQLQVLISDETAFQWVTCINVSAEKVLGKSKKEFTQLFETDPELFNQLLASRTGLEFVATWIYKLPLLDDDIQSGFRLVKLEPI